MTYYRLRSIDIAKGICILIVLVDHAIGQYGKSGFWGETGMNMYKLPLFFFVSGMFFSPTDEFNTFIRKKIKKLIIPFLFFYVSTVIISPILLSHCFGLNLNSFFGTSFHDLFIKPFTIEVSANGPIWFVWCLIIINIYYYIITFICDKYIAIQNIKYYISFFIGVAGICLAYYNINIPAHLDSAMSALPFFSLGQYIYNNTMLFDEDKYKSDKYICISVVFLFLISILAYPVDYRGNTFNSLGYLLAYPLGFLGTLSIIVLSKRLTNCRFFNYCGRFSLVILCTHTQIQQILGFILTDRCQIYGWKGIIVNTVITIPVCLTLSHILSKYLPSFVGQQRS